MEGLSKIAYKGKEILYVDYSAIGSEKEKAKQLILASTEEYMKYPPKSVLALVNVENLHFDSEIVDLMKTTKEKTVPYEKKIAIIGMKGLQKVAYNFVISLTQRDKVKTFNTAEEAKEWLSNDIND